ncbi:MAG: hypothetical protein GX299_03080, partial [Epulopiscium sp.]|nr:hypothetical protein [Candidatus Epulonipiscium sp.]
IGDLPEEFDEEERVSVRKKRKKKQPAEADFFPVEKIENGICYLKDMVDTREIEKKAYITVYEKTECDDLAGYIADDFGLIADSIMLHYSDEWLEKVISCYKEAIIPCGKL